MRELTVSPRVRRIADGEGFLPGFMAIVAPGHTPGHLLFTVSGAAQPVLFTGDAAKNRAELLCMTVNDTYDMQVSRATLEN